MQLAEGGHDLTYYGFYNSSVPKDVIRSRQLAKISGNFSCRRR
jgi:hypothetical protein